MQQPSRAAVLNTFLRSVTLLRERVPDMRRHPFTVPAVRSLTAIDLHPKVTYFVGENGSGKSTLLEAIAVAAGFNAEGGSKNFNFRTHHESTSALHEYIRLTKGVTKPRTGFFLRAESFFNVATEVDRLDDGSGFLESYGGKSLHDRSHGEGFLALFFHRFGKNGLYLLDEPEAALSPSRQLVVLKRIHDLVEQNCQFIIATHSPILASYPDSTIYEISQDGMKEIAYEETELFTVTRDFVSQRDRVLHHLFQTSDDDETR